jgi:hypothetical protein
MAPLFLGTRPSRNQLYVSAASAAHFGSSGGANCAACSLALIYAHCNFSVSFQLIFSPPRPSANSETVVGPAKRREKEKNDNSYPRGIFFAITDSAGEGEQMGKFWEIDLTFTASDV